MEDIYSDVRAEISHNFLVYADAVNTDRAIPDAKSGLKPVARRILFDMYDLGIFSNKPHKKSALVVGDVMGRFHPHGDSSIYGALVRLAQEWVMRYPLIDFHGNKGGLGNDGAAAQRYTEIRLSKLAESGMVGNMKKNVVDFMPNYSEDEEEPVTLPSLFPNLLCNPNTGIGVAMACNWLPHNLNEVTNAILAYLENSDITIDELVEKHLFGPDFPLGGKIVNKDNLKSCYKNGRGRVIVQSRYELETRDKKQLIVFKEIPFGVNIEELLKEINKQVVEEKISGIDTIQDESDENGIRLVIILDKGANIASVVNKLYHQTNLQSNSNFNQVALVNGKPVLMNLKDALEVYVTHQTEMLVREIQFDLAKAEAKLNILNGLMIALEDIDNVIALIKGSKSSADAKVQLEAKYKLNEAQSKAIVEMKLGRIAGLEKIEVQNDQAEAIAKIAECKNILASQENQHKVIAERLSAFTKIYGDARRTEIAQVEIKDEEKILATVEPEDVVVSITKGGHIKRVPVKNFKIQKRNGKGLKNKDDSILDIIKTNTVDTLVMFSSLGKMYRIIVDDVPEAANAATGTAISSLVKMAPGEEIIAITSLYRKSTATSVVFVTAQGMIKKSSLEEYNKGGRSTSGIIALKLKENDKVVQITFLNEEDLILITKGGMSIRVETKDINPIGRVAMGVRGINLKDGDFVVAALPVHKDTDELAIFTRDGYGKKVPVTEFIKQGRNGRGVSCSKNDNLVGAAMVSDDDNVLILGTNSSLAISAKDIPSLSKTSLGNIMIKDNSIISIVKI